MRQHNALGGREGVGAEELHDFQELCLALQQLTHPGAMLPPLGRDLTREPTREVVERVAAVPVDRREVPLGAPVPCRAPRTCRGSAASQAATRGAERR